MVKFFVVVFGVLYGICGRRILLLRQRNFSAFLGLRFMDHAELCPYIHIVSHLCQELTSLLLAIKNKFKGKHEKEKQNKNPLIKIIINGTYFFFKSSVKS